MGSSKQTQTSTATPYTPAQPLIKAQAQGASDYLASPDPTERAAAGASRDYLSSVVGGDYLDAGNPHMQALMDSIKAQVMPSVNGTFSNAGLANSTLHQGMLEKALTEGFAQPLFANYQNERGMEQQAAAQLPGAAVQASNLGAINNTLPIAQSFAPYASQTQTSQTKQPLFNTIAGGALALGGLASGFPGAGVMAQGMLGNPLGNDMGLHAWQLNTYVNGSPIAPWVTYR